jgi:hypothetical protein
LQTAVNYLMRCISVLILFSICYIVSILVVKSIIIFVEYCRHSTSSKFTVMETTLSYYNLCVFIIQIVRAPWGYGVSPSSHSASIINAKRPVYGVCATMTYLLHAFYLIIWFCICLIMLEFLPPGAENTVVKNKIIQLKLRVECAILISWWNDRSKSHSRDSRLLPWTKLQYRMYYL